ncbi:MAG: glycosyl transferase [Alphaproteobacteria bacterium PA4]|nr:MAG: glycosyl transferase [Alphaproteobacteria bacterium PA4]
MSTSQSAASTLDRKRAPQPQLGIVLVNWNRWTDTIECLESVFRSTIPIRVVVVDNDSQDGSLDRIAEWAAGQRVAAAANPQMAGLIQPPIRKPISTRRFRASEMPGNSGVSDTQLSLVESGGNLGFAGGNNVGLRLLLSDRRLDYFWLLNNDTVIDPMAAESLLLRMQASPRIGMCGTVVRYYHRPDAVQALNGSRFNRWTGQSQNIGIGQSISAPFNPADVVRETDFVLGASLAVTRPFLEKIGPMEERYFLYYEEIDWATRSDEQFDIGFAHGAIVWHKEGGSIGSSGAAGARSAFSDYWLTRSRLRFTRLHHPPLLAWHWLLTLAIAGKRLLRRQPDKAWAIMRALFGVTY